MCLPFVGGQLCVVHVSEITVWRSALQFRSIMMPPLVAGQLAVLSSCVVAVGYSTLQFGGSMVFPHVV